MQNTAQTKKPHMRGLISLSRMKGDYAAFLGHPKIAIIVIGTLFQQILIIANTTRMVDRSLIEAGYTLGTNKLKSLFHVVIPAALPDIYRDLRVLLGWAWTYLIVSELIGTTSGITWFITQQARYQNYDNVYGANLIIGVIGLVCDWVLMKLLKLYFERPTDNSVMLFNFRNIIPDSYKHDLTFGVMDDYDGLIYEYTDPTDDSRINIYLPDKGAKNPKEVKSVGVRNKWQAHFNAYRLWNKLRFQRKSITFDAAPESELLVLRDRIAVADYRNGIHQSGEVVQQEGLILTLSHDVDFIAGKSYVIYLQMGDGTVDLIPVTAGSAKNKVVLGRLPNGALKLSPDDFVNTIYTVVNDDTKGSLPYLVAKREPADQFSNTITAINYDERYYLNDKDFIDVPVDDSPIYIRYDQLDINLARLYQMK